MKNSFTLTKFFFAPLAGLVLVAVYSGVSPKAVHACGAPTSTQLFCSAAGTAPPGFGTTFQNNLIDPLGGQCTAGGPGCTNDTYVDPGIGECTDGSTGCNAGPGTALPVSNDPCISCFTGPGEVGSLFGGEDQSLQPVRDYLAGQRRILDFQRASFDRAEAAAADAAAARGANADAIASSEARIADLKEQLKDLNINNTNEEWAAVENPLDAEEDRLYRLTLERDKLVAAEELANRNVQLQADIMGTTSERIATAERTGQVPETPGGLLTQFGGGGEATQEQYRMREGENSSFNRAVANGGYSFELDTFVTGTATNFMFDGEVGSQFLRSTSGHATTGDNLSAGTIAGAETYDKPFLIIHQFMQNGLRRKLIEAVRRGDIPGTITIVRNEDDPGKSTREVVNIPPEGLEAAKPYLDAADSLFEGAIEEDARTTSDLEREQAQERRERENQDYEREAQRRAEQRAKEQRANPVQSQDVKDNTDPNGIHSVIDEIQSIIPLA